MQPFDTKHFAFNTEFPRRNSSIKRPPGHVICNYISIVKPCKRAAYETLYFSPALGFYNRLYLSH
ncbi:MAG: hypothetical protein JWO06_2077 [Bacteroidota bacterium]|nr:hypothetical protein [Bacteroidota bacterium]